MKIWISLGYPNPPEMARLEQVSSMFIVNVAQLVFGPLALLSEKHEAHSKSSTIIENDWGLKNLINVIGR